MQKERKSNIYCQSTSSTILYKSDLILQNFDKWWPIKTVCQVPIPNIQHKVSDIKNQL